MIRIALLGIRGRVGATLAARWAGRFGIAGFSRRELDLSDLAALRGRMASIRADWVVNCAGLTNLEECEADPGKARAVNGEAVGELAEHCSRAGIRFLHFSTDYVFDGKKRTAYVETDPANPLGAYGASKLEGEKLALAANPGHYVFRVSWVFGPGRPAFPDMMISRAAEEETVRAVCDKWASPTSASDIADWLAAVIASGASGGGLFHLCNSGVCSWREYAQRALDIAQKLGLPLRARTVKPIRLIEFDHLSAPRPVFSAMDTSKFAGTFGVSPRPWREALEDYLETKYSRRPSS